MNSPNSPVWILAVDTSGQKGGIALARDGELIEAVDISAPDGFGHVLFGFLDELLHRHKLRASDIACFAAASGPGSFTGLRVALAAVKGLAEAVSKPALGVSNLQAVAWHSSAATRAPYFDARREQIYGGLYNANLSALSAETVMRFEPWRASLPSNAELVTFDGSLAPAVAAIAHMRYLAGELRDPAALEANYVRQSDAELNWKDDR